MNVSSISAEYARRHAALLWWAACAVFLGVQIRIFAAELGLFERSIFTVRTLKISADALLILLPYWLLPGRFRGLSLVPLWGMALLFFTNALSVRFTGDCLPLNLLSQAKNIDTQLTDSIFRLLRPSDIIYWLPPTAASALWCVRPLRRAVSDSRAGKILRSSICAATLIIVFLAQVSYSNAFYRLIYFYNGRQLSLIESTDKRLIHRDADFRCQRSLSLRHSGIVAYMLTELYEHIFTGGDIKLSDVERKSLDSFALHTREVSTPTDKNIIFIVAESLNADAVGTRINDRQVTPVLDSLIAAYGTISCLHVVPQVHDGISSDGQLLYNTGLLPLRSGAAAQRAIYGKRLPSLACQLSSSHSSMAIFAERGLAWREKDAYKAYGYNRVLTSDSIAKHVDIDNIGADAALMEYALLQTDSLRQPFFIQLLTASTHYPFNTINATTAQNTMDITEVQGIEADYLNCVHYLDSAIGNLVEGLKQRGLVENTILIVASDHHMNMDSGLNPLRPIVFVAAGCGTGMRIDHPVAQADVFPTLCSIAGLRGSWRGLGYSMTDNACGAIDYYQNVHGTPEEGRGRHMRRAWTVSDSLLRSDYFR